MDKSMVERHIDMSMEKLMKQLEMLYEVPAKNWDCTDTDMIKDIWEAVDHMLSVKQKMQ